MNLQQLKYAVEIARVGSISKAAKNLYMGQPNLSKSIKELEAELGQTLFSRTARGVQPTRAGEDFLGYARSILSQVESLSQLYRKDGAPAARLHMAAPRASYISNAFSAFAAQLSATGTALDLDYRETNSMDILHAVASGGPSWAFCAARTNTRAILKRCATRTACTQRCCGNTPWCF